MKRFHKILIFLYDGFLKLIYFKQIDFEGWLCGFWLIPSKMNEIEIQENMILNQP